MKILGDRHARSRERTRITPSFAGTVIPTRARELGHLVLYRLPNQTGTGAGRFENHHRTAFSGAMDIQRPAADINRFADLLFVVTVTPSPNLLVGYAGKENGK